MLGQFKSISDLFHLNVIDTGNKFFHCPENVSNSAKGQKVFLRCPQVEHALRKSMCDLMVSNLPQTAAFRLPDFPHSLDKHLNKITYDTEATSLIIFIAITLVRSQEGLSLSPLLLPDRGQDSGSLYEMLPLFSCRDINPLFTLSSRC